MRMSLPGGAGGFVIRALSPSPPPPSVRRAAPADAGLRGTLQQRPGMRRKRDRPRRPLGLGVQGTRWPRRVLTAPRPGLAWSSTRPGYSRGGGGAARALGWWRDSSRPRLSPPPTRLRPLGGDARRAGCVRGAPADHRGVDGAALAGRVLDVPENAGSLPLPALGQPSFAARKEGTQKVFVTVQGYGCSEG